MDVDDKEVGRGSRRSRIKKRSRRARRMEEEELRLPPCGSRWSSAATRRARSRNTPSSATCTPSEARWTLPCAMI